MAEHDYGNKPDSAILMRKGLEYLGEYNNNNFKFFQMAVETYEDIGMVSEGYELLNQICEKVSNK